MGALTTMNDTFRFFQKRYADIALPAVEGWLIMMAAQFLTMPIVFIFMFSSTLSVTLAGEAGIVLMVVMILIMYGVMLGATAFALGIMYGGMVRSIDDIRNHRKVKFGDTFKYGWKHKWELFRIQFLNSLLFLLLNLSIFGIIIGIGLFLFYQNATAALIFMMLFLFVGSLFMYTLMPLQYMPFIVRHKKGMYGTANIGIGWKEFFTDFSAYGGIGFLFMLLIIIIMFIPFVGIIAALALHPAFISALLIYYDEKYKIPVIPKIPEMYQNVPVQQYPQYEKYQGYPPRQGYPNYPPGAKY